MRSRWLRRCLARNKRGLSALAGYLLGAPADDIDVSSSALCGFVMMDERASWPGLDEVIDLAQKEQWGTDETAVLYAGKLLAKRIEAHP